MAEKAVPPTLSEVVDRILEHITPNTDDKSTLDVLTRSQVLNATWRVGQPYRDTTDANVLVPKAIYELSTNKAWRYPPMLRAEFEIEANKGTNPALKLDVRFGVPQYVRYAQSRADGTIRMRSTATVAVPDGFGELKLVVDDKEVPYQLQGEAQSNYGSFSYAAHVQREIVPVNLTQAPRFEHLIRAEEQFTIIRRYSASSGIEDAFDTDGTVDLTGLDLPDPKEQCGMVVIHRPAVRATLNIEFEKASDSRYRVTVMLHNQQPYTEMKSEERIWRPLVMLLPTVFIRVANARILIRPQQHADVFERRLHRESDTSIHDSFFDLGEEGWLEEYSHVNGVLTRSTKPGYEANTLVLTCFGVYDTARIDPIRDGGLERETLLKGPQALLTAMTLVGADEQTWLNNHPQVLKKIFHVLYGTMRAFGSNGEMLHQLRLYQWHAIQKRIQQLIAILQGKPGARDRVRVIRAPTAAGKTLVFMTNAALHVALTGERAVLAFPTRILNEDMFKRLTRLVKFLREELPDADFRGGLLIGQSDPLFRALTKPKPDQPMVQFGACPHCPSDKVVAALRGGRTVGVCPECGHVLDYMYDPNETGAYLPNLVIATPDKLFYQATTASFEQYSLRFFGAKTVRCECGQYLPLDPKANDTVRCRDDNKIVPGCGRLVSTTNAVSSSIGYWVFDEVHSLHGLSATLLSCLLDLLYHMASMLGDIAPIPVFETGTATIANEQALLEAITRRSSTNIEGFPTDEEYLKYFKIRRERVRYRTVAMLPVGKSSLMATAQGLLHQYEGFYGTGDLRSTLNTVMLGIADKYAFALGYLYRKRDIYNVRHTLDDMYHQTHRGQGRIQGVDTLSGDSDPAHVSKIMQQALDGELRLLLANLVVSLGIDIADLNNLMMFGFPASVIEYVQTAGRTGRSSQPGHVTIYLNPVRPRDNYLFRYFYQMLGDVSGYYESKPAAPAGVYAADIMLPNVVKGLIAAAYVGRRKWMISRHVADDLKDMNSRKQLLARALKVLAGPKAQEATGHTIAAMLKDRSARWISDWGRDQGFISNWFVSQELLLTSLRESSDRTVEVQIADPVLYESMNGNWTEPDSLGGEEGNGKSGGDEDSGVGDEA